jgi:hypothetical protein
MQSREVGYTPQPECLAQFAVLAKTHFRLAKGTVLAAHQVENGQQLWLVDFPAVPVTTQYATVLRRGFASRGVVRNNQL